MSKELRPYKPTHPGEVLKDELLSRKITQKKFTELISIPYTEGKQRDGAERRSGSEGISRRTDEAVLCAGDRGLKSHAGDRRRPY